MLSACLHPLLCFAWSAGKVPVILPDALEGVVWEAKGTAPDSITGI